MRNYVIAIIWLLTLSSATQAQQWLKKDTPVTVKLGPFVDSTDGVTAETGLTIQKADVRLSKNGGNMVAASADQGTSDMGAPHDELGYYDVSLDDEDTDTPGRLRVMVSDSEALPVWQDFMVVPASIYDSLVEGSQALQADVTHWNGTAIPGVDTAGYPKVTIKDGTGSGEVDTNAGKVEANVASVGTDAITAASIAGDAGTELATAAWAATTRRLTDATNITSTGRAITVAGGIVSANAVQISGDSGAADAAERFFDGTGYGPVLGAGELDSLNSQTQITLLWPLNGPSDDSLNGLIIVLREGEKISVRTIVDSNQQGGSGSNTIVVDLDSAPTYRMTTATTWVVLAPSYTAADRTLAAAIKTKTDFLPSATPGAADGLFIAGTNAPTTVNIVGSLSGSVGSINGSTFESIHLDHLFASPDPGSVVANDSFWAKLLSKGTPAAYSDYDNTTDSLQAQRENFDTVLDGAPTFSEAMDSQGYTTARALKLDTFAPSLLVSTTIDGAPASQMEFTLADGPPDDDALNGALIIVTSGSQKAVGIVRDYVGSSQTVTLVTDPGIFAMAAGDQVDIIAGGPIPLWLGAGP